MKRHISGWGYLAIGPHLTERSRPWQPQQRTVSCQQCGGEILTGADDTEQTMTCDVRGRCTEVYWHSLCLLEARAELRRDELREIDQLAKATRTEAAR